MTLGLNVILILRFYPCSPDKDLKQISCNLYNGDKLTHVTPDEADYWFWTQCLG